MHTGKEQMLDSLLNEDFIQSLLIVFQVLLSMQSGSSKRQKILGARNSRCYGQESR